MLEKTAVFFDVDDTLLDNYSAFKCTIEKFFPEEFSDEAFLKQLYRDFRGNSEKIYQKFQEGQLNTKQNYNRWYSVLEELNQKDSVEIIALDEYYHFCQSKQRLSTEMVMLLNVLKKSKIFCGILTNGFTQQQQKKLDQLGMDLYIEPKWQFISEDLGDTKPNVSCFKKVASQLPAEIAQIYYLGDSYKNDIAPAHLARWNPIWLNRFADEGELLVPQATTNKEVVELLLSKLLTIK
ncbi:HAD family hydrolase [Enterococcus devriesei]|uniref:HAD family hydrolase n=1 Tax=Enterococcus devriesei TaxID=319970 RepID=UPI001C0F917B|nr:HAD family hydrolase [Enterococcus devriesei]MBU5365528.1 HAD family hydrolase [Enterococcus devriesei]